MNTDESDAEVWSEEEDGGTAIYVQNATYDEIFIFLIGKIPEDSIEELKVLPSVFNGPVPPFSATLKDGEIDLYFTGEDKVMEGGDVVYHLGNCLFLFQLEHWNISIVDFYIENINGGFQVNYFAELSIKKQND